MTSQSVATILVVEDHREFQELVTALLEAEGYAVTAASTGTAALAVLETLQPDLILLDSSLPDGDSTQLAGAIRARRIYVPIVLMTTNPRLAPPTHELGRIDTLVKPFSTSALLTAVRNRLTNSGAIPNNPQTGQISASVVDVVSPTRDLGDGPPSQRSTPTPAALENHPVTTTTGQWEYCQLIAAGRAEIRGETYYSVDLIFMGTTLTSRRIASREGPAAAPWTTNPWKQTIGLLGQAGWEMVNIQHGDYAGRAAEHSTLSWNTVVAYFRRPVVANRPITEPKISLTRT